MLSPKKKKKEGLLYQAVSHKMSLFLHHDTGSGFAMVETFLTRGGKNKGMKANSYRECFWKLLYVFKKWWHSNGENAKPVESDMQDFEAAAHHFNGSSFQLSLPTHSAMCTHSWPLIFPWPMAISQSSTRVVFPLFSSQPPFTVCVRTAVYISSCLLQLSACLSPFITCKHACKHTISCMRSCVTGRRDQSTAKSVTPNSLFKK